MLFSVGKLRSFHPTEQGCGEFKSGNKLKLNSCSFNTVTRRTPSELGSARGFSPSSHTVLAVASSARFQHTGLPPGLRSHPSPPVQPQSSASSIGTTWERSKNETSPVPPTGSINQNLHFNKIPGDSRAHESLSSAAVKPTLMVSPLLRTLCRLPVLTACGTQSSGPPGASTS